MRLPLWLLVPVVILWWQLQDWVDAKRQERY